MEAIDANEYLIQFLGSIDNLPSEIHYHFTELTNKDQEIEKITDRIERRKKRLWCLYDGVPFEDEDSDCSVVENKRRRVARVITEFEDEEVLKDKIIKDYVRASQLQDEKIEIADKALVLVERHIKRLDEDFSSLFPHYNLRECINESFNSASSSPSRIESMSAATTIQTITDFNGTPVTTRATVHQPSTALTLASTSTFPNTTPFDYNNGLYYPSGADTTEEGQFCKPSECLRNFEIPLPLLPNPSSSSATRCNKDSTASGRRQSSIATVANNGRRRKQSHTPTYVPNVDSSTPVGNNAPSSRSIKLRLLSGDEHINTGSSIVDQDAGEIDNSSILDSETMNEYDNTLVAENSSYESGYVQPIDPNEPVYCVCRQVSFGEMIGCDGENCPFEWYHLDCVGLKAVPEGRWFCDHCTGANQMKKRKRGRPAGSKNMSPNPHESALTPNIQTPPQTQSHTYYQTTHVTTNPQQNGTKSTSRRKNTPPLSNKASPLPSKSPRSSKY
ncbi:9488_t:CDS:10 [Acaulospora morrowiae]|uniref:Chromatin modification-related protein n=1 Tax=Acaulospora morrowiae TaxID=94023 RepID=A0A9N9BZL2_9GLOM|nr:9488_t:CDS:10 [Acaulospora morrowiae]